MVGNHFFVKLMLVQDLNFRCLSADQMENLFRENYKRKLPISGNIIGIHLISSDFVF